MFASSSTNMSVNPSLSTSIRMVSTLILVGRMAIAEVHEGLVRVPSAVVFDWDNTLKQYDSARRSIRSGVDRNVLEKWKDDR
jgi:hypothetical protein